MDIERNPGPPCSLLDVHPSAVSFVSIPARHSFSTIPIGLVNVVARKVYTREELLVIRAQNYRGIDYKLENNISDGPISAKNTSIELVSL